jgi:hypothetical protein
MGGPQSGQPATGHRPAGSEVLVLLAGSVSPAERVLVTRWLRDKTAYRAVLQAELDRLDPGWETVADGRAVLERSECRGVGQQMLLQGRLHGPESLSPGTVRQRTEARREPWT